MTIYNSAYTGAQIDAGVRKSISRKVASLYVSQNEVATAIAQAETYYLVDPACVTLVSNGLAVSNCRITNSTGDSIALMATLNVCLSLPEQNIQVRMRLGRNGVTLPQTCAQVTLTGTPTSGRRESIGTHTVITLAPGDYLEPFIANWTNSTDITVRNMQFTAVEL
jgi:hypothetical protein